LWKERATAYLEEQALAKRKREDRELHDNGSVLQQQQESLALVVHQQQKQKERLLFWNAKKIRDIVLNKLTLMMISVLIVEN